MEILYSGTIEKSWDEGVKGLGRSLTRPKDQRLLTNLIPHVSDADVQHWFLRTRRGHQILQVELTGSSQFLALVQGGAVEQKHDPVGFGFEAGSYS